MLRFYAIYAEKAQCLIIQCWTKSQPIFFTATENTRVTIETEPTADYEPTGAGYEFFRSSFGCVFLPTRKV